MKRDHGRLRRCRSMLLAATLVCASIPALSAERRIELMPTIGVRNGASLSADVTGAPPAEADPSLSFGLALDVELRPETWFEAFFERQTLEFTADPATLGSSRFDVDVDYLQVGTGYGPRRGKVRPYVTASVGLTHFGASGGSVTSSTGLSGSLGGGLQVPIGQRIAFRFETRGYATVSDSAIVLTCGPGCVVRFGGGGWYQIGARAGLMIRL